MARPQRKHSVRGPREDRGVLVARIIRAARASFSEHGWAGTTIRQVARDADVDPALVHYYFDSKEALLDASTTLPPEWIEMVRNAAAAPVRRRGEAIVRTVQGIYSNPELAEVLRSLLLTAAHEPRTHQKLVFIMSAILVPAVAAELQGEERELRASLASTQIIGLAMVRYIWRIEPLASLSDDAVVALVAPSVQRYLTGKLPTG